MRVARPVPAPVKHAPGLAGWAATAAVVLVSGLWVLTWLSDINAKCHAGTYLGYACTIVQAEAGRPVIRAEPAAAPAPAKPAALQYSFSVWPSGSISEGETRTISTPHGELRCASEAPSGTQTVSNGARTRTCWWN